MGVEKLDEGRACTPQGTPCRRRRMNMCKADACPGAMPSVYKKRSSTYHCKTCRSQAKILAAMDKKRKRSRKKEMKQKMMEIKKLKKTLKKKKELVQKAREKMELRKLKKEISDKFAAKKKKKEKAKKSLQLNAVKGKGK